MRRREHHLHRPAERRRWPAPAPGPITTPCVAAVRSLVGFWALLFATGCGPALPSASSTNLSGSGDAGPAAELVRDAQSPAGSGAQRTEAAASRDEVDALLERVRPGVTTGSVHWSVLPMEGSGEGTVTVSPMLNRPGIELRTSF